VVPEKSPSRNLEELLKTGKGGAPLDLGGVAPPATGNTQVATASVLQRELAVLPKTAKEAGLQLDCGGPRPPPPTSMAP